MFTGNRWLEDASTFPTFHTFEVTPPGLRNWKRDCNIYPRASGKLGGVWGLWGSRILGLQQKAKPFGMNNVPIGSKGMKLNEV